MSIFVVGLGLELLTEGSQAKLALDPSVGAGEVVHRKAQIDLWAATVNRAGVSPPRGGRLVAVIVRFGAAIGSPSLTGLSVASALGVGRGVRR